MTEGNVTDESPPLFAGEPEHCALCGEAGHTHDDHWLLQFEYVEGLRTAIAQAITWLVTVKADQPASIIADRARLALEALQAAGKAKP